MGCCLGTVNHHRPPPKTTTSHSPPPPPPPFEEETVKEVLSETPIIVPKTLHTRQILNGKLNVEVNLTAEIKETASEISYSYNRQAPNGKFNGEVHLTENITADIKENMSEIYSYSESFSAATTVTTMTTETADVKNDDDDGDGEVTQKLKNNKSPPAKKVVARKRPAVNSGEFPGRKERGGRRHVAASPERKRSTNTARYRNVGPGNDSRREVITGRRSRSPVVRGDTCQRRKVVEKGNVEKVGELLPVEVGESEGKSTVVKSVEGDVAAEVEVQGNESIENPLVSLECFIFL